MVLFIAVAGAVIVGMFWGTVHGVRGAFEGAKEAATTTRKKKSKAWESSHPDAPRAVRVAARAGVAAGALIYGPPAIKKGGAAGFRAGLAKGREWADNHRPPGSAQPAAAKAATPEKAPSPAPASTAAPGPRRSTPPPPPPAAGGGARPASPRVSPRPRSEVRKGRRIPAIISAHGGVVHTAAGNFVEADSARQEAASELQDADPALGNADVLATAIHNWAVSLHRNQAPGDWLTKVTVLAEHAEQIVATQAFRKAAADEGVANARRVFDLAARDASQTDAVGPWYQNQK